MNQASTTYGRLTILGIVPTAVGRTQALVRCTCGTEKTVQLTRLKMGHTRSCGCLQREKVATTGRSNHRHGHYTDDHATPEYRSWRAMKARVLNPNAHCWDRYGGRGITIHPTWLDDFAAFLRDMGPRPLGTSLDRIDNLGNYEPGNCRWATPTEQTRNRRPEQGPRKKKEITR